VGEPDEANPLSAAISPDGRQLAMHRVVDANVDIWLLDTVRGSLSRLTTDGANDIHPLWSQDGRRIFFASNRGGSYELYEWSIVKDQPERKVVSLTGQPTDLSRDGRILLFNRRDRQTNMAIWMMPLDGESKPSPVVPGEYDARDAQFSNDGRWIAYSSAESGRTEIYVQPFPGPGQKAAISIGGGAQPRWRKDGTELFYIRLDGQLMVVPIALPQDAGAVEAGTATPLFATRVGGAVQMDSRPQYIVSPDGQRFLMNTVVDGPSASPIALILNWKPPVRP
jgi:Tol biopolymer transport system component